MVSVDQLRRAHGGGIETYVRGLIRGLCELSHDERQGLSVEALAPAGAALNDLAVPVRMTALGHRSCTALWAHTGYGVPSDAEVIHATSMAGPFFGGAPKARHSVLIHDLLWREHPELSTPRGARFHERRLQLIRRRDQVTVIVTTERLATQVEAAGIDPARVHVIGLGVSVTPASQLLSRTDALARAGARDIGAEDGYCLLVSTVQPRKNIERLIVAHSRARQAEPSLGPLLIVGATGWGAVDLTGAVGLGRLDDVTTQSLLAHATVATYVPLEEGWGFPAIEALAHGRRLVASRDLPSLDGIHEGWRANPADVDDVTEALLLAARAGDDVDEVQRRRDSVAHLSWRECARAHVAVWQ